jgi:hypothetical protein
MSINGSAPKVVVLMRIDTPTVIRLSTAFGDFPVPANSLDAGEETYTGLGAVEAIPVVQQLLNGVADRATFTLSGVPAQIAALADADAPNVNGVAVNLGLVKLDADEAITGAVFWLGDFTADKLTASKGMDGQGNESHQVTLSVGTAHVTRSRPEFAMWTDAQNQRRHPGDQILSLLPTGEKQKRWPI